MVDKNCAQIGTTGSNCFKEAVCIDAGRIFDSCSDKDCLEDLRVNFTDCGQADIDAAANVKCKRVEIADVLMDIEPVAFNKGFYSVDMTFYFLVKLEAYCSPLTPPKMVEGIATFSKKVILYGSEGNVKTFSSANQGTLAEDSQCVPRNLPRANVQLFGYKRAGIR